MKIWFDTEFIEDGNTIELLSIGMVREDGAEYYAEPAETDRTRANGWVKANVLPHLNGPIKPRRHIAPEIIRFAGDAPEFWAYYASYDWVALCQLFGTMMDLPKGWPMYVMDLMNKVHPLSKADRETWPAMTGTVHNALADAKWLRDVHLWLGDRA